MGLTDDSIGNPGGPLLVLDLMLLLVKLTLPEKVIDSFVVLSCCQYIICEGQCETHNFQELAFHLVFPAFRSKLFCDAEDLLDRSRDHASSLGVL